MKTADYEKIIKRMAAREKVKLVRKYNTDVGRADIDNREIDIPKKIDSPEKFCVCLHEIAHIRNGHREPIHHEEYLADSFAIRTAKKLGVDCSRYERRAKNYVMMVLCEDIANHNLQLRKVSPRVIKFISDIYDWKRFCRNVRAGKKPFYYNPKANGIEIIFKKKK